MSDVKHGSRPCDGPHRELDEHAARILAFETGWGKHARAKEEAIRELFDLSPPRYYQILDALVDSPAALAHDPVLINRLQRVRDARAAARAARRLGGSGEKKGPVC